MLPLLDGYLWMPHSMIGAVFRQITQEGKTPLLPEINRLTSNSLATDEHSNVIYRDPSSAVDFVNDIKPKDLDKTKFIFEANRFVD